MRPLPLSTCVIFQPANSLSTPVFRSRCNFSSRNTPVIESSLVQLLGILPLRRLAPFLPPLFSRRFSTIRLNRSPFRFSLASTKSVCLDATSEKLEDRNCSDVTEFLFFFSKLMILSYREIFLVLSKRSWGLWSWIIISRRNGDFFSRKKLGKSLRFVLTRDRVSPGEYFLQENSISTLVAKFPKKIVHRNFEMSNHRIESFIEILFSRRPRYPKRSKKKTDRIFKDISRVMDEGSLLSVSLIGNGRLLIEVRRNSFQRAYCGWLRVLKRGKNPKGQTKLAIK